jgi:hypothetical protein
MASKRRIRRKACEGKVRHATQAAAMTALKKLQRTKGRQGLLVAYRCKFCRGFHFGHAPQRVRQAIALRNAGRQHKL